MAEVPESGIAALVSKSDDRRCLRDHKKFAEDVPAADFAWWLGRKLSTSDVYLVCEVVSGESLVGHRSTFDGLYGIRDHSRADLGHHD